MKRLRPFLPVFLCLAPLAAFAAVSAPSGENPPAIPGAPSVEELDAAAAAKAAVFAAHPDPDGAREAAAFEAGAAIASRAPAVSLASRAAAPTHTVYGWAPYWQTSSDIASYEYSNLTHVAYFSYEVNPTNGGCLNMHGWTTTPLVETAHANGVKVVLTATLFGSAGNKLLLQNATACNRLATNLVNAVVSRGGDGICIDFESVGSWTGATAALNKFMTNLVAKAHAAGLEVGIALPSVDWYADFGVGTYEAAGIDQMLVMGYDYYYAGSSTPGPVAPLKSSAKWVGASSWCSVDYSVQYYLGKLSSPSKLMLAVPFYGRRWGAKSAALGAESLGSSYSSALAYASCASLASAHGRHWESNASVPYCVYTDSSVVRQCFYDDAESLGLKFDYAKTNALGGIGIWCLTQAHSDLWGAVADAFGGAEGGDAGDDDNTGSETEGLDATQLISWDFTAAEGWKENGNNFTGTTNAAGGEWYFKDIDVYPSAVNDADTGYLDLQVATDHLFAPVSADWSVTRIETVARPYSTNAAGRELTLLGSTDGGATWRALGSFRMTTPNANTTNSLTLPVPLSGAVRIAVSNSASYSIKLCRLSLFGLDTSGDDTAVEETGGDVDASGSNPSWWFEFVPSEGWTTRSTDYTGATNAAGGTWSFSSARAYPENVYDGNAGAIYLNLPSNSIRTPVFSNASYSAATVVARPFSGGANREMTLLGSTNGGASFGVLGSFPLPATANATNVFSFERPLAGNVVLAVSNSGTAGSLYVLALGLAATATNPPPAADATAVSRWFDFIPSEGWTQHTNNYTGTTNVNSGTWHFQAIRTTPEATYDGNAGSLGVYNPNGSSSLQTPVFPNETLSSATLVARPYGTGGAGRALSLFVSTDGGNTFTQAGSMAPTAAVNLTNTFAFSPPLAGDIVLKVENSGTAGSIRLLALGTEGTRPDEGGGEEVPEGAAIATYDFVSSEGWVESTNDFTGTTNAAGGTWYFKDIDVYPADRNDADVGYLDLQVATDYLFTPVWTNAMVTGAVTVARPYSIDANGRRLTLLGSTNGGSAWTSLGSFDMTTKDANTTNTMSFATPLVGDVRLAVSNSASRSLKLCRLTILGTADSSSGGGESGGGESGEGGGESGGGGGGSAIDIPTVSGLPSADAEQPRGVLSGVTVFTSGGHGYTANSADTPTYWYTGRGNTHDVNEDAGNLDQLNFFAEEAWRMGATVVPMRPLGHQTNEVVLDNTSPSVSFAGNWADSAVTNWFFGRKGAVAYRYANANPTGVTATAVYRPSLPAAGEYPVYTWVRHGSDRVNQHYRIHHAGGTTSVRVHHGRVGSGWVWLGNYFFAAGTNGCVEILNDAPEETSTANVVVADAIRFGNGMGDIARGNAGVSGYERELEASRYWIQRQVLDSVGYSSSIYDLSGYHDQSDNVGAPPRMAVNMVRTNGWARWRRVYIGFHSNAGSGSARGTWGLYDTRTLRDYPSTYGLWQTNFASLVAKRCQADLSVAAAEGIVPSWTTASRIYGSSYGEIYGGSICLAMDAIINEVAFHDNAYDAAVLKTLAGREWLARASARGTAEFLSRQYAAFPNALVFPPDAPVGVKAVADGTTVTVGWRMPEANAASGGAPDGFTVYASPDGTAFGRPVSVPGGNAASVVFEGLDAGQTLFFRVAATNAGGESAASAVVGARTPDGGGKPATLVVSAFERADASLSPKRYLTHYCASSGGGDTTLVRRRAINARDYVKEHGLALAANGEAFDSCGVDAATPALLTGYRNIIWCLGEESTDDETFSAEEQAMVSAFLAGGGNLFASGAEIAWDLGAKGSASDAAFLADLGAAYAADSSGTGEAVGAASGIFAGTPLSFRHEDRFDGTYAAGYPDVLAATNGAKVAAVYGSSASGSSAAAVAFSNATYRTVVMGFPFELIENASDRARAMGQVLAFFAGGSGEAGTGGLSFTLDPPGATWTVGGVAYASGETAQVPAGPHSVVFSGVEGFATPAAAACTVAAGETNRLHVAYEPLRGGICCTLVPGNGTWILEGVEYASGETAEDLEPGTYEISFSGLAGYTAPDDREVVVSPGATNAFTVAYGEVATGTLTFTLVPPEGATWSVAGTTNASGESVSLPAGNYTVSFGAPAGYYKPSNRAVTVTGGQPTAETQVFDQKPGSIKITLKPDGLAGAAWRVLGTNYASGATAKVPAGTHEITFLPVEGYVTPEAILLAVAADKTVSRTVTYREEPATGTVAFTLLPAEGTSWTIDGNTYASGETATVEAGDWTVTFGALEGWTAPAATNVTVVAGGAFAGSAAYTENEAETLSAPVLAAATDVATNAFSIAWGAVEGATGYAVEVATDDTFAAGGSAWTESFEEATALPAGWSGTAPVATAANYAADGSNAVKFAASGKSLTTPLLSAPETLSFHWSTGSNATNWQLGVYVSNSVLGAWTNVGTVAVAAKTNATETIDLSAYGEAVVKFVDERGGGTAARYLDSVAVTTAQAGSVVFRGDTAVPSIAVDGLAPETTYFVRAMATNETAASGWSASRTVTTEAVPLPPAAPVLEEATDVTSNAFSIAWSAVAGAGIYQLQVAETAGFDEEPILSCDFTGDLPAGWETTGELVNETSYAAEGKGAIRFTGKDKWLRSPLLARPGTLTWHHATTSTNEWRYELQASPTIGFETPVPVRTFVVTQKLSTAVVQTENLRYYRNVYLRWVDTRPSGTAQRFLSGISLTGALVTNATVTATAGRITALAAETPYFVRVRAWGDAGWSEWSEVKPVTTEAAPVAPATGTVTFTLDPAEGTTWTIDENTYASGETATVEEGTYTVTFGALGGYETPAAQQVVVTAGQAVAGSATYAVLPAADGILTFTLVPAEGTTWIVAGTTNASGDAVSLPAGDYTVRFGALAGYTKPTNRTVAVLSGQTTSETAAYTVKQVPLTVKLSPTNDAGLQAEARWRVVGIEGSHASGESWKLDPGDYTVTASDVEGWTAPPPTNVTLNLNSSGKTITMKYAEAPVVPATGTVTFTLDPAEGTTWTIAGNTCASGDTATVEEGTYTVTFGALDGWTAPAPQEITVAAGNALSFAVAYEENVPGTLAAPVLAVGGKTAESMELTWNAVADATGYRVQVALDDAFSSGGTALAESFEGATALPAGWSGTAPVVAKASYAAKDGGSNVVKFAGSGKYVATPLLAAPETLSFHWSTGSNATDWQLGVYVSNSVLGAWTNVGTIAVAAKTNATETIDLSAYGEAVVKFVDEREAGSAERYLDAVTVTTSDGSLVLDWEGTETALAVEGLESATAYFFRALATNAAVSSAWSGVATATTEAGGGQGEGGLVELVPLATAGTDGLHVTAGGWPDAFAVEFTTNLADTNAWTRLPAAEWTFSGGELVLPATNAFSAFRLVSP